MKALSIHQPWAWAILHAGKNVENRAWPTHYRGPLLIHASKSLASLETQNPTFWQGVLGVPLPARESLTFGAILGIVDVVGCVKIGPGGDLGTFGKSVWAEEGLYGWVLGNPRPFATPISYRGAQQLFDVPDEAVAAQLKMQRPADE
jgi:hypothetical protein